MKNHPRILLIDEDPQDRALAAVVLSRDLPEARIDEVGDARAFAHALREAQMDLVISEVRLGWSSGLEILEAIAEGRRDVPVVAFSAERDEELVVELMKAGMADFVFKSSRGYLQLPAAVQGALQRADTRRLVARSEPWLQTLLDRANIGVFRSTMDERLIESNRALLRLLGVESVEEVLKIDLPAPYFRAESRETLLERLSRKGEMKSREVQLRRADGSTVWLRLSEVLVLDVDGDIVVDVVVSDVSDLKEREETLSGRVAELERSNADLGEFAYVASHELQEPLRMVEKYSGLLLGDGKAKVSRGAAEALGYIEDGARRMQDLIKDLLQFSRINTEGQAFQACDCNSLVEQSIRNLHAAIEESQAEIRREGLPTVLGDSSQLIQLFQNLLSNAIKFRRDEAPRVRVSARQEGEEWRFTVEDNGIGIEPGETEKIFGIFHRLNPELPGTGMGLTICQRIVERHGGRIWAESQPGKGSSFYFTLPLSGQAASRERDAGKGETAKRSPE